MSGLSAGPRLPRRFSLTIAALALLAGAAAVKGPAADGACPDADDDGYADCLVAGCAPEGRVCGDCDDGDPFVHPGAAEACNHVADACGAVDSGFPQVVPVERVLDRHRATYDRFGFAVVSFGDADADGIPDFAVGNPWDDLAATDGGSVTLYSGADRTVLCRHAVVDNFAHLGTTLAAPGDLDADGVADLAAGAAAHEYVMLISGADCSEIGRCLDPTGLSSNLGGHHGLGILDDVTGDGLPEIIAGADTSSAPLHHGGRALVFSPSAGGGCSVLYTLSDPALVIYANLGFAVSGIDDVSGDGVADIAVGEPGDDHQAASAGSVLIFSGADGAFLARRLDPLGAADNRLGESLAAIPDANGDGVGDLIAGAARRTWVGGERSGEVLLLSGADGAVLMRFHDPDGVDGDWLGYAVAVLDDVDGDGLFDVAAGAPYADRTGAPSAGRTVVFSGADGSVIRSIEDPSGSADDQAGYSVATAGDLSGDGVPEILIGAPYRNDGSVTDSGVLLIASIESDCDGDGLGPFGGDCNDADGDLWRVPSEVLNLAVAGSPALIAWDPPADPGHASGVILYDTLRATSAGGIAEAVCLETADPDLMTQDGDTPPPDGSFFYLVRARNLCGPGSLGRDSEDDPRPAPVCP